MRLFGSLLTLIAVPVIAFAQGQTRTESEPNDEMHLADFVALHDTMVGAIAPGDKDVFTIHADSGTYLHIAAIPDPGSSLVPHMYLWDSVGYDLRVTSSAYPNGQDRNIWFPITRSGYYFVQLSNERSSGATNSYHLFFRNEAPPPVGPGDPFRIIAIGVTGGMVAGSDGDFYVASQSHITRVPKSGGPSTFATFAPGYTLTGAIAIDAGGNFLVAGDSSGGVVWRISPSGARSLVYHSTVGCCAHQAMAVAPNGDIWVSQYGSVVHLDKQGTVRDTIHAFSSSAGPMCSSVNFMAFSPKGELHYTASPCSGIFKLDGNKTPKQVYQGGPVLGSFAFDRDGYIYILNGIDGGRVMLLDPQYRVKQETWASRLQGDAGRGGFSGLAFAKDRASGNTMARIFLAYNGSQGDGRGGWVVEFNKNGVRAPGWPVGARSGSAAQLKVTGGALRAGVVGTAYADTLKATDAAGTVTWSITNGALAPGLTFDGPHGTVRGTPTDTGSFAFDAKATSGSQSATGHFTIHVSAQQQMQVEVETIAAALMEGTALTADQIQFLDQHGNHNGKLDVGDLRAYLRARGMLAAPTQP